MSTPPVQEAFQKIYFTIIIGAARNGNANRSVKYALMEIRKIRKYRSLIQMEKGHAKYSI